MSLILGELRRNLQGLLRKGKPNWEWKYNPEAENKNVNLRTRHLWNEDKTNKNQAYNQVNPFFAQLNCNKRWFLSKQTITNFVLTAFMSFFRVSL
jgi:hypothetical protein